MVAVLHADVHGQVAVGHLGDDGRRVGRLAAQLLEQAADDQQGHENARHQARPQQDEVEPIDRLGVSLGALVVLQGQRQLQLVELAEQVAQLAVLRARLGQQAVEVLGLPCGEHAASRFQVFGPGRQDLVEQLLLLGHRLGGLVVLERLVEQAVVIADGGELLLHVRLAEAQQVAVGHLLQRAADVLGHVHRVAQIAHGQQALVVDVLDALGGDVDPTQPSPAQQRHDGGHHAHQQEHAGAHGEFVEHIASPSVHQFFNGRLRAASYCQVDEPAPSARPRQESRPPRRCPAGSSR